MADQTDDGTRAQGDDRGEPARQATLEQVLALVNSAPSLVYFKDTDFRYRFINDKFARDSRKTLADMYGRGDEVIMPPEFVEQVHADELKVMESGKPLAYEEEVVTPKGRRHFSTVKMPVFAVDGTLIGIGGIVTDVTERKEQELEQQRMIAAQREALRELSTPLLPIAEGVLAVPLVGVIDAERARQIVDNLLHGIAGHRAHTAILDITGIRMMDTEVARALVQAARAAKLVGARVVLTGISPEVAQTLVALGVELGDITTLATLAHGIAFALREA